MNYEQSRAYIDQVECYGRVLGLENIEELTQRLGNPQEDLNVIHVAGTNGKRFHNRLSVHDTAGSRL